jgi:hypothetical protein
MMGLLQRIEEWLLACPAFRHRVAMLVDATIVIESFAVALLLRFDGRLACSIYTSVTYGTRSLQA